MDEDILRGIIRRGFVNASGRKGYMVDPVNTVLETMTDDDRGMFYEDEGLLEAFDLAWWDYFQNGSGGMDCVDFIVVTMRGMMDQCPESDSN